MRAKLVKISNRAIEGGIILVVFSVPLLFFPFVSKFGVFEFAKQMFLYFTGGTMLFFWALRIVAEGKVEIRRTFLDFPIILFLAIYALATVFSIDRWTSVFGDHPYLHGGLISVGGYALFYYLVISSIKEKAQWTRVALAMCFSAGVVSVVGVARFFKLDVGIADFGDPVWLLLGSAEKTAVWLTMVFPILLVSLFSFKQVSMKILFTCLGAMLLGYLALLNFYLPLILAGATGILVSVMVGMRALRQNFAFLILPLIVFGLAAGVNNVPLKNQLPFVKHLSSSREISLGSRASWSVVLGGFNLPKNIFLGSGPATYLYDFSSFRPAALNTTPFWSLRFSRASNELFQLISTVGLAGLAAFVSIFIVSFLHLARSIAKRKTEETLPLAGTGIALFNFLILGLFTTSATATSFYAWILFALLSIEFGMRGRKNAVKTIFVSLAALPAINGFISEQMKKRDTLPWIVFSGTVLVLAVFFLFEGKYLLGDAYHAKSVRSATIGEAMANAGRAVTLFPQNVDYRIARARISITSAVNLAMTKKQLTKDEERDLVILLITARDDANAAVNIAPRNPLTWETRGDVFLNLAGRFNVTGAEDEALRSYISARQISSTVLVDPFNPRYPNLIGFIQHRFKKNLDLAQQNFFFSLTLKPDYAAALYNLAQVYKERGNVSQAEQLVNQILEGYDALDVQQIADLGISKEQLQKERDVLNTSSQSSSSAPGKEQ